ncbi:MAG: GcrA cell cycle regulator [Salinarimonas sp.]|nr:GcrA cell cycle regulator [Salinarimonas sp.]
MTDASVTWNDERVEQLKKLWAEGKSASQIAAEIGGISRNAVIGKVHRLGLAGRPKAGAAAGGRSRSNGGEAKPGEAKAGSRAGETAAGARKGQSNDSAEAASSAGNGDTARSSARTEKEAPFGGEPGARRNGMNAHSADGMSAGNDRAGISKEPGSSGRRGDNVEAVPEFEQRVTIMELREGMCRWPIGDPTSPEFRFCGARSDIGSPYCDHHARIAYQPAADRRRERKAASG